MSNFLLFPSVGDVRILYPVTVRESSDDTEKGGKQGGTPLVIGLKTQ